VVGIINTPETPLAEVCDHVLAAGAAPETSIAATKSVILSWLVGRHLIARLAHAPPIDAVRAADVIAAAQAQVWTASVSALETTSIVVLGRGAGHGAAREIALKLKELVGVPAEAISAAEVMHGPRAMIGPTTGILAIATEGATLKAPLQALAASTLRIVIAGPEAPAHETFGQAIPIGVEVGPDLAPMVTTAALYGLVVALARRRGRDPDRPRHLSKVTLTR
jgi:glucosamine--fructose-6-phosphate aminotransferase (isomerizing)